MLLPPVGIASTCKRRLMLVGDARGQKRRQGNEAPEGLSSKLEGSICLWKETFHPFCLKLFAQGNPPHPLRHWPTYHLYHVLYYIYLLICLNTPPKWKLLKGQILEATNPQPGLTVMYAE